MIFSVSEKNKQYQCICSFECSLLQTSNFRYENPINYEHLYNILLPKKKLERAKVSKSVSAELNGADCYSKDFSSCFHQTGFKNTIIQCQY